MSKCVRIASLGLGFALAAGGPAAAAPQILGLVATATPMPLTCAGGQCTARLSAFCLQRARTAPVAGAPYRAAAGTRLTLSFTGPDGVRRTLPAAGRVSIAAWRDYHVVEVALPESALRALGGREAAIAVGPLASLVPVAEPGDPAPLDAAEIAYVTGPHRAAVARAVDADAEATVAVGTLMRLINALPPGRATAEARRALWRRAVGQPPTPRSAAGLRTAARAYRYCRRWADASRGSTMRDCLGDLHDARSHRLTVRAWKVTEPGS